MSLLNQLQYLPGQTPPKYLRKRVMTRTKLQVLVLVRMFEGTSPGRLQGTFDLYSEKIRCHGLHRSSDQAPRIGEGVAPNTHPARPTHQWTTVGVRLVGVNRSKTVRGHPTGRLIQSSLVGQIRVPWCHDPIFYMGVSPPDRPQWSEVPVPRSVTQKKEQHGPCYPRCVEFLM